jgi:hypothetical protein
VLARGEGRGYARRLGTSGKVLLAQGLAPKKRARGGMGAFAAKPDLAGGGAGMAAPAGGGGIGSCPGAVAAAPGGAPIAAALTPAEQTLNRGAAALEVAVAADRAGNYPVALARYQDALDIIFPILAGAVWGGGDGG